MGHSEMLLAVAGLDDEKIGSLTKKLASGDWSTFTVPEQIAFRFAYRLSKSPDKTNPADLGLLIQAFGPERAVDIVWYISWCNYMTRVADANQFPLERTNVFAKKK